MRNLKNSEQGAILVFTLLIMITLMTLGMAILPLTVMEYKASRNFSDYQQAISLAEAGVEEAMAILDKGWNEIEHSDFVKSLKEGQYEVSIENADESNVRRITSTGRIRKIERAIEAKVKKPMIQTPGNSASLSKLLDYIIQNENALDVQGDFNLESAGNMDIYEGYLNVKGNLQRDSNLQIIDNRIKAYTINDKSWNTPPDILEFQLNQLNVENYTDGLQIIDITDTEDIPPSLKENEIVIVNGEGKDITVDNKSIADFKGKIVFHNIDDLNIESKAKFNVTGILILNNVSHFNNSKNNFEVKGMLLANNVKSFEIKNNTTINGVALFNGVPEINIKNNNAINGTLISLNDFRIAGIDNKYFSTTIKYDETKIRNFLNDNEYILKFWSQLTGSDSSDDTQTDDAPLEVISWQEVQEEIP